ncbi:proline-rich protein 12-like [Pyrus ussuriensis x Pyrus communis]|uniref:Proline-rich protein 12-like n=1 Tax=Pyrus ussuriensis x Pyrus communis TaxID=2448454 RepID=A0A5N5G939_9ROSA|nr:proline-rich protein 12-like [Pyrus ussuriensis x Pyrus communis]
MASFISKLSEEINKCKDFIDRNTIKTVRFEDDMAASHQILGPIFKDAVPSCITDLLKEQCLTPLLQGLDWSKWSLARPQGAWPSTTTAWAAWVDRMRSFFGEEWKALGIYDAIMLSTMEITMDKELLMAALTLWCSATNTMILPFGPLGPTVLDVSAILGTSPSGLPIDAALSGCPSSLDLKALFDERAVETLSRGDREPSREEVHKLHKNFFNYNTLILHFAGRGEENLRKGEHEAFLFYWYNKFICCTRSNKCLVENMPVAQALASGHSLAFSPAILANLFRCLAETTINKIDPHQNGPLWVFQLWLQIYFSTLRPEIPAFQRSAALGPQLASRPAPPHRADEVLKHFFSLDVLSDDEFLVCRRQEYPASIGLPTAAWAEAEDAGLRQSWGSIVLARDLPLGCPVPLLTSRSLLSRGRLSGSSERECRSMEQEFQDRCKKFRPRPIVPESLGTETFGDWWDEYTCDFFGASVEDVVSKVFGDRPELAPSTQPKESAQGGRGAKKVEVVAAAARVKKLAPKRKTIATERPIPSKRPHREAEPEIDALRPSKRVKKLAKKGDREIHVVSSDVTGTPASAGSPTVPAAPASPHPISPVVPLPGATADPIVAPAPASEPAVAPAMGKPAAPIGAPSTPTVILEDIESESDEVPLERRRGRVNSSLVHPPPVVEATARPTPPAADRGKRPMADPEATAESPIHPQDADLPIPPQEVSSAYVSLLFFVLIFQ